MNKQLAAGVAGLFALSTSAAGAETISCATVAACIFGSNTSSGIGVEGGSKSGAGVTGTSTSGYGLSGISSSNHGVNGSSSSSFGVVGTTTENATSKSNARAGVLGQDSSNNKKTFNSGVAGTSAYGYGGSFTSTHGIGLSASSATLGPTTASIASLGPTTIVGFTDGLDVSPDDGVGSGEYTPGASAIHAFANSNFSRGDNLILGTNCTSDPGDPDPPDCEDVFEVDNEGDITLGGMIVTNSSARVRTKTAIGTDVASFDARTAAPSLEDVGKASLRNGTAYVPLDRTFAASIDPRVAYSVFVTPEGDSNGLYTTQLTQSGFAVHENKGGRSTMVFDYRVVAKPLSEKSMHLPAMSQFSQLAKHTAIPKALLARVRNKG